MTVRKRIVIPATRPPRLSSSLAAQLKRALATPAPEVPLPKVPNSTMLSPTSVTLGCDPEFFFEQAGEVVGSEKVIGKQLNAGIVMDGVQVELNPPAGTCRETLAGHIAGSFRALKAHLNKLGTVKASFTTCINLSKKELDSLSDDAKKLGCAPSLNRADAKAAVTIDGATATRRSAGGHIHLGLTHYGSETLQRSGVRERIVDILDILLGNTCVLLDRDPHAADRRKVYGKAGEYRLPTHGLEYRTLSNFWLRHYVLMSFVMGVARQAVNIVNTSVSNNSWDAEGTLRAMVGGEEGLRRVRLAINTNNWELAKQNFDRIKPFITTYLRGRHSGLSAEILPNFETLVTLVNQKGLEAFFPEDPLEHWARAPIGGTGWENFIAGNVTIAPATYTAFSAANLARIKALPNVDAAVPKVRKIRKIDVPAVPVGKPLTPPSLALSA